MLLLTQSEASSSYLDAGSCLRPSLLRARFSSRDVDTASSNSDPATAETRRMTPPIRWRRRRFSVGLALCLVMSGTSTAYANPGRSTLLVTSPL